MAIPANRCLARRLPERLLERALTAAEGIGYGQEKARALGMTAAQEVASAPPAS